MFDLDRFIITPKKSKRQRKDKISETTKTEYEDDEEPRGDEELDQEMADSISSIDLEDQVDSPPPPTPKEKIKPPTKTKKEKEREKFQSTIDGFLRSTTESEAGQNVHKTPTKQQKVSSFSFRPIIELTIL